MVRKLLNEEGDIILRKIIFSLSVFLFIAVVYNNYYIIYVLLVKY